jgi:hypothetical protein
LNPRRIERCARCAVADQGENAKQKGIISFPRNPK